MASKKKRRRAELAAYQDLAVTICEAQKYCKNCCIRDTAHCGHLANTDYVPPAELGDEITIPKQFTGPKQFTDE